MTLCKSCNGIGSVNAGTGADGNKRRCSDCNGTGLVTGKPAGKNTSGTSGVSDPGYKKHVGREK